MKEIKTINAVGKTNEKAMRQAKRWFSMNPNRLVVNVKLSNTVTKTIKREEVL